MEKAASVTGFAFRLRSHEESNKGFKWSVRQRPLVLRLRPVTKATTVVLQAGQASDHLDRRTATDAGAVNPAQASNRLGSAL